MAAPILKTSKLSYYKQEIFWRVFFKTVSVCQPAFLLMSLLVSMINGTAFATIETNGFLSFIVTWCVFGIYYWSMGFILILPMYAFVFWVSQTFRVHHIVFYGIMGFVGGIIVTSVFMIFDQPIYWVAYDTPFIVDRIKASLPIGLFSGTIGGLSMWYFIGRHPAYFYHVPSSKRL